MTKHDTSMMQHMVIMIMATGGEEDFEQFEDHLAGDHVRIEVFSETQSLMLKRSDLTIDRLSRVFKVAMYSLLHHCCRAS